MVSYYIIPQSWICSLLLFPSSMVPLHAVIWFAFRDVKLRLKWRLLLFHIQLLFTIHALYNDKAQFISFRATIHSPATSCTSLMWANTTALPWIQLFRWLCVRSWNEAIFHRYCTNPGRPHIKSGTNVRYVKCRQTRWNFSLTQAAR